jgi:hypothetical protein
MVDGSPATSPPTLLPYRSATIVPDVTQILPTTKDNISFNKKMLSIQKYIQNLKHKTLNKS